MRLNESSYPPQIEDNNSIYHFPVASGVILGAASKSALIDAIYEFRVRNGGALDTIEREIDDYYCKRWPTSCTKETSDYGRTNPSFKSAAPRENLLHRVSRWAVSLAARMPKGGFQLVTTDEARRRQDICAVCACNRSWRTGCKGCSGSAANLLMTVRGLRKGRGDVYGCEAASWDSVTASSLPVSELPLSEAQISRLAEKCWRR